MAARIRKLSRREFLIGLTAMGGGVASAGITARLIRNRVGRDYDPTRTDRLLTRIKPAGDSTRLPNIILIVADDLGFGDLGVYGGSVIQTPVIDNLAAEGVLMSNFYACSSTCTPSRAALLTGRYPKRALMTLPLYPKNHPMEYFLKLVDRYQYDVTGIPPDEATLAEMLQRRGYRTGLVGKWHLGDKPGHLPNDNGFDDFYGALYSNDISKFAIWRNDEIEISAPLEQSTVTQDYTREALNFIRSNSGGPFFLYLAHTAVHEPLFASDGFRGRSDGGLYGDSVQEVDWSTGKILDLLKELGVDDDTLVIFTSDNGPWWQGDPGEFRGRKANVMEGGLRVPFIARWPDKLPAGNTSDGLSINFDIFPTCLACAGIDIPTDRAIDGKNILPLLQGKESSPHERFFYYDGPILVAVRDREWKYHRRHMSDNGGYPLFSQGPFLFNLEIDPNESYNQIERYPEVARELADILDAWEDEMETNIRGWLRG